ncbi:MAG TPA: glycerate kinase [Firmicutes bacterium]|nr:glycerate kinase [Bacillota bacterium]
MKILVAMNAFKGNLSGDEACSLVASGVRRGFPEAQVQEIPLADGGDGTIDVLTKALGGHTETLKVTGPYGSPVEARVGLVGSNTAIIESAACSGLALGPVEKADVFSARSHGVGEIMLWAAKRGIKRIIIGIGGTAMNDGGIGMVQAAGGKVLDNTHCQVMPGVFGLKQVFTVEAGNIPAIFEDVEIIGISDVTNSLIGPGGATYVYGPQKGLKPGELQGVDRAMDKYGLILARDLGRDPRCVPMSGAGGGLGAALWSFFGANLVDGAGFILKETGCLDEMNTADIVITGEGRVDAQTEKGKVPHAVGKAGLERGVPVIVVGGGLDDSILHKHPPEYSCLFDSTVRPMVTQRAMDRIDATLPFVAEQIARLCRTMLLSRPVRQEKSAGGIVLRTCQGKTQVLMIKDRFGFSALPKGHVEPGETWEQGALREVKEETGIDCTIVSKACSQRYRFFAGNGTPLEKTVAYYVMQEVSGKLKPQFDEVSGVLWVNEEDLDRIETYPNLRTMLQELLTAYTQGDIP